MIKSVTVVEVAGDWTLEKLGLPTTYRLAADGRPELGVFSYPGLLMDCCTLVDTADQIAAWVHGTDCTMTKAVKASMDQKDSAPHVPECHRRAQGGSFRALPLPPAHKRR